MVKNNKFVVTAKSPSDCTSIELSAFKKMVLDGGEVNPSTLTDLMMKARSLAFMKVDEKIIAVGAIKRPNASYRAKVFAKANAANLDDTQFEFELGWVFVHTDARGKGFASSIVEALVQTLLGAPAYATSRSDNKRMHTSLTRFGFKPSGTPYPSTLNDQKIQLFILKSDY